MDAQTRRELRFHAAMEDTRHQAARLGDRPTLIPQEKATLPVHQRAKGLAEQRANLGGESG